MRNSQTSSIELNTGLASLRQTSTATCITAAWWSCTEREQCWVRNKQQTPQMLSFKENAWHWQAPAFHQISSQIFTMLQQLCIKQWVRTYNMPETHKWHWLLLIENTCGIRCHGIDGVNILMKKPVFDLTDFALKETTLQNSPYDAISLMLALAQFQLQILSCQVGSWNIPYSNLHNLQWHSFVLIHG